MTATRDTVSLDGDTGALELQGDRLSNERDEIVLPPTPA
jgi:hypothetical protein